MTRTRSILATSSLLGLLMAHTSAQGCGETAADLYEQNKAAEKNGFQPGDHPEQRKQKDKKKRDGGAS